MPRRARRINKEEESAEEEEKEWDSDNLDGDDAPSSGSLRARLTRSMSTKGGKRQKDGSGALPLPDESDEDEGKVKGKRKAKRESKKTPVRTPKRRKVHNEESDDEDESLADGQQVVGVVVQAPTTGLVPPGQISQNMLNFLNKLKDKECNDRQWFKLHEPVFRQAEKEFRDFIDCFTEVMVEADPQVPHLPAKDVIYRIYRDVRFSNDKTPYKQNFSASFSRSGRKGVFAGYHLSVEPGNQTLIGAGSWCPGKNELATIRSNIQRSSRRLRQIITSPTFVSHFGEAKPHRSGKRQNIFGREDELKVAPKGINKDHPDIDLLKCRSFSVIYRFTDSEVLEPGFGQKVQGVVEVMRPFVHCLNDLMTVGYSEEDEEEQEE